MAAKKPAKPKKPVLSVQRFSTWDSAHQAEFLKKHAKTNAASFAAMSPAEKRAALAKGRAANARERARLNDPSASLAPLTPAEIARQSATAADYKYGASQNELGREDKRSELQSARIAEGYKKAKEELAILDAQQKAANVKAQTYIGALGTNTLAQAQSQITTDADAAAKDAAARGAGVDPQIAAKAEQAAQSRKNSLDLVNSVMAGQAKNQDEFMGHRQATTTNQGIQALGKEEGYRKTLSDKVRELLTEKGQYRSTVADDLRKQAVERDVADRAFGLQVSSAAADAQAAKDKATADAKSEKDKKTEARAKVNQWGFTEAEWRAKTPAQRQKIMAEQKAAGRAPKAPKSKYTDAATFKARDSFQSGRSIANDLKKQGNTRGAVLSVLVRGQSGSKDSIAIPKVSADVARAIVEQIYDGHISKTTIEALHKRGIRVKDLPVSTKPKKQSKPAKKPDPGLSTVAGGIQSVIEAIKKKG